MEIFSQLLPRITTYLNSFTERCNNFPLPLLRGEIFLVLLIIFFVILYRRFNLWKLFFWFWRNFILTFELAFEKIYEFFSEIMWGQKFWVKSFVIGMFFVILFSNLMGTLIDCLNMMFPWLNDYISAPTSDTNFNIAMALISVSLMIYLQFRKLWIKDFFYNYLPIFWKNYITFDRGNMPKIFYYPLYGLVKIFDIIISLFVGILDIIWTCAKVISLSFRLTWNMMSWTILLGMVAVGMNWLTDYLVWIDFPILVPIIIILQWLLVAVIQAFVFSLLTAIFIKTATEE